MRKSVTLLEVAERCGVSICTVSQALRGYAKVSAATRERVKAAAEELGYEPSEAARIMAGRRRGKASTRRIAVGVVRFNQGWENARHLRGIERELEAQAHAAGLDLQHVSRGDFGSAAEMGRVLWNQGVQGLILLTRHADVDCPASMMAGFPWEKFSVVKVSRALEWIPCHCVRSSSLAEMREALERIVAAGYRRVVVLIQPSQSEMDDWGRHGALAAFEVLRPGVFDQLEVIREPFAGDQVSAAVVRQLKRSKPELVLGFPGWGGYYRLLEAGFRFPEDFAYAGFPVHAANQAQDVPSVAGVLQDFGNLEFPAALQMLLEELRRGARGFPVQPYEHVLPAMWQDGATMPGRK